MTKNQVHEWHERTEEGQKRYFRGYWDSRQWRVSVLEPGAEHWLRIEQPDPELWVALRDVVFRKYQRKRVPYRLVEGLDALLAGLGLAPNGEPLPSD